MVGWPEGVLIKYLLHLSYCFVVACLYVCLPPKAVNPPKGKNTFYTSLDSLYPAQNRHGVNVI